MWAILMVVPCVRTIMYVYIHHIAFVPLCMQSSSSKPKSNHVLVQGSWYLNWSILSHTWDAVLGNTKISSLVLFTLMTLNAYNHLLWNRLYFLKAEIFWHQDWWLGVLVDSKIHFWKTYCLLGMLQLYSHSNYLETWSWQVFGLYGSLKNNNACLFIHSTKRGEHC